MGRDSRESGRAWSRSRTDLQSCTLSSASREPKEIKLNLTDLYEVMSSEGTWYPATIRRLKRNGRYEADLYGGGCVVAYPSVKVQDIRLRRHRVDCSRNRSLHDLFTQWVTTLLSEPLPVSGKTPLTGQE